MDTTDNERELRDWQRGTPKSVEGDSYGEGQNFNEEGIFQNFD